MTDNIVVMITCSSKRESGKIKKILLEKKKVACVNVISEVGSFFWWNERIDSSIEVLLLAKTKKKMLKGIVTLVKKVHSYEVPEIIALPIIGGNEDYLHWISRSIKEKNKKE